MNETGIGAYGTDGVAVGPRRSILPSTSLGAGLYVTVELVIAIVAVFGNLLIVYVFAQRQNRSLRIARNYYIVGLACADFLFGLVGIPASIVASLGWIAMGLYGCLATCSVLMITVAVSTLCLLAVGVDRFWATYSPLHYHRNMDGARARALLAICTALGVLMGLLPLFGWYNHDWEPDGSYGCRFRLLMDYNYLTLLYFTGIVCPATLIAGFYGYIFYVVHNLRGERAKLNACTKERSSESASQSQSQTQSESQRKRKEARAGTKLLSIILAYLICWFPINTINCVQNFCPDCPVSIPLLQGAILVSHANAAINPFLYAYHLKKFREPMKNVLFGWINR